MVCSEGKSYPRCRERAGTTAPEEPTCCSLVATARDSLLPYRTRHKDLSYITLNRPKLARGVNCLLF